MKRKQLSNKARFEIFKRDSFTCQYCGNSAPTVILNIDHIKPIVAGGDFNQGNLITACFNCNSGKGIIDVICDEPSTVFKEPRKPSKQKQTIQALTESLWYCVHWMSGGCNEEKYREAVAVLQIVTKKDLSNLL